MRHKLALFGIILSMLVSTVAPEEIICVPALGRIARPGETYNAVNNQLTGRSIFETDPPPEIIDHKPKVITYFDYHWLNSLKDKLESVKASLEMSLSFLFGLIQLSGNVNYVGNSRTNSSEVRGGLTYTRETGEWSLKMSDKNFTSYLSKDIFKIQDATHFIHRIKGGAAATVEVSAFQSSTTSKTQAGGMVKAYVSKLQMKANGSADGSYKDDNIDQTENVKVRVTADCSLPYIATTAQEALDLMQEIPELLENATTTFNESMQLEWCLYPLPWLEKLYLDFFKGVSNITSFDNRFKRAITKRLFNLATGVHDTEEDLFILHHDAEAHRNHIPTKSLDSLAELQSKFSSTSLAFMDNASESYQEALKDKGKQTNLIKIMSDFEASPFSQAKVKAKLDTDFDDIRYVLRLVPYLQSKGITAIGKKIYVQELLTQSPSDRIFIFFDDSQSSSYNKDFTPTFESFELARNGSKFYVNCKISATKCEDYGVKKDGTTLKHYALGVDMQNIPQINDTVWTEILHANYELHKTLVGVVPAFESLEDALDDCVNAITFTGELVSNSTAELKKSCKGQVPCKSIFG